MKCPHCKYKTGWERGKILEEVEEQFIKFMDRLYGCPKCKKVFMVKK